MVMNGQEGISGPKETELLGLMERTGYSMIQENGQRKFGGPPPEWTGPPPQGCEIFVGKIPRDLYEDELVPAFERIGTIYELRLMMDFSGSNRGYCFVMFTNKKDALRAVQEMNNFEIRKGRFLGVCLSVDNCRLFVGGIPKTKVKREILEEMSKVTEGVVDVIVYPSASDKSKNRGFAFVEYETHRAAAMARRKLIPGRIQLWGHQIAVDWAEPEQAVDDETMSKVKILYVRNLMLTTSEATIQKSFCDAVGNENAIERVKKLRDYAFVHFKNREDALRAKEIMNDEILEGSQLEVSLAKPVDKSETNRQRSASRSLLPVSPTASFFNTAVYADPVMAYCLNPAAAVSAATRSPARITPAGPIRGKGRGAAGSRAASTRHPIAPGYVRALEQHRQRPSTSTPTPTSSSSSSVMAAVASSASGLGMTPVLSQGLAQTPILAPTFSTAMAPGLAPALPAFTSGLGASTLGSSLAAAAFPSMPLALGSADMAHTNVYMMAYQPMMLDEMCRKHSLGQPSYMLLTMPVKLVSGEEINMFMYKIIIPALSMSMPGGIVPTQMSPSADEAKAIAADFALRFLQTMGFQMVETSPEPFNLSALLQPLLGPLPQAGVPLVTGENTHNSSPLTHSQEFIPYAPQAFSQF